MIDNVVLIIITILMLVLGMICGFLGYAVGSYDYVEEERMEEGYGCKS